MEVEEVTTWKITEEKVEESRGREGKSKTSEDGKRGWKKDKTTTDKVGMDKTRQKI